MLDLPTVPSRKQMYEIVLGVIWQSNWVINTGQLRAQESV